MPWLKWFLQEKRTSFQNLRTSIILANLILFVWFDSLRPIQKTFSHVGMDLPESKRLCSFREDFEGYTYMNMKVIMVKRP